MTVFESQEKSDMNGDTVPELALLGGYRLLLLLTCSSLLTYGKTVRLHDRDLLEFSHCLIYGPFAIRI
jgi:hypothetical protein